MAITVLFNMDSVGNWVNGTITAGDQNGVSLNTTNKKEGTGALNLSVDVSLDANHRSQFQNLTDSKNLSSVAETGYFKFWIYIPNVTNFSNIALQVGSDITGASNRYIGPGKTTDAFGNPFQNGWNLYQVDWSTMTKDGTPNNAALVYWYILFNYTSSFSDTTFIIDNFVHDSVSGTTTTSTSTSTSTSSSSSTSSSTSTSSSSSTSTSTSTSTSSSSSSSSSSSTTSSNTVSSNTSTNSSSTTETSSSTTSTSTSTSSSTSTSTSSSSTTTAPFDVFSVAEISTEIFVGEVVLEVV